MPEIQTEWLALITAIVAAVITIIGQVVLFFFNRKRDVEIEKIKKEAAEDKEFLIRRVKQLEEVDRLKRRYSTPLLKSAEELYNKLNDMVKNRERVLGQFGKLPAIVVNEINSIGDVLSSRTKIYLTSILYLFARYFANVEAIKKDLGLLQLASDKETRALQSRLKQSTAVFFSGRLHRGIDIRVPDRSIFEGSILEGAQVLIGESMLNKVEGSHECISYYEFCHKIGTDEDFRQSLSPLLHLLSNLESSDIDYSNASGVDFRWAKLILFGSFLRELVKEIDTAEVITLLPEFEEYEQKHLMVQEVVQNNLRYFKEAYPDP
jgi:hypothetical protein